MLFFNSPRFLLTSFLLKTPHPSLSHLHLSYVVPYHLVLVPSLASSVLYRLALILEIETLLTETTFRCADEGEVRTWCASIRSCSLCNGNVRWGYIIKCLPKGSLKRSMEESSRYFRGHRTWFNCWVILYIQPVTVHHQESQRSAARQVMTDSLS